MIGELGSFSLMLALGLALLLGTLPLAGAWRGRQDWIGLARPAAAALALFVTVSFGLLLAGFAQNDFSIRYVAAHSNSMLPLHYRLAGAWGGHEGSLLLWIQVLALWLAAVACGSRRLPEEVAARVLAVMGLIAVGFLAFILFTSNPFERLLPAARDGSDLNPLLQDIGMIIHPPLLYMGYVGFSVAFAFAVAALLGGRLDAAWARYRCESTLRSTHRRPRTGVQTALPARDVPARAAHRAEHAGHRTQSSWLANPRAPATRRIPWDFRRSHPATGRRLDRRRQSVSDIRRTRSA